MHYGIEKSKDKEEFWVVDNNWTIIKKCDAYNSIGDYTTDVHKFMETNGLTGNRIALFRRKLNLCSVQEAYEAHNRTKTSDIFTEPTWMF